MGLFDRLFGRQKEEKPVENIPEEAVEIVSEDDQGKNLEKVETAPVENTQSENLDEQTFQTELKERFAEDEARLETIQEKVEEMEPRLADIVADAESAENDSQAPEIIHCRMKWELHNLTRQQLFRNIRLIQLPQIYSHV